MFVELYINPENRMCDIAKELGVSNKTPYEWLKNPNVVLRIDESFDVSVDRTLRGKFLTGQTSDRELFLKYKKRWNPTQKIEVDGNNKVEISFTDLVNAEKAAKVNESK
jgi:hypothetical protein